MNGESPTIRLEPDACAEPSSSKKHVCRRLRCRMASVCRPPTIVELQHTFRASDGPVASGSSLSGCAAISSSSKSRTRFCNGLFVEGCGNGGLAVLCTSVGRGCHTSSTESRGCCTSGVRDCCISVGRGCCTSGGRCCSTTGGAGSRGGVDPRSRCWQSSTSQAANALRSIHSCAFAGVMRRILMTVGVKV